MNIRLRIVIACVCAGLAGASFAAYAREIRGEAEKVRSEAIARYGGEVAELAVANRTLEAGEVLSASDLTMREWLTDLAPEGAVSSLDDVLGRVLTEPLAKGTPLTDLNFREAKRAVDVPAGHVAVTIPSSEKLGMSVGVEAGSKILAYRVGDGTSEICATDVVLLSTPTATSSALTVSQPITIAVLPNDVNTILSASASGDLRLVLPASDVEAISDEIPAADETPSSVPALEDTAEEADAA